MIYLDNAATSRFKPSCAIKAYTNELLKSSNSGRSGHKDSIDAALRIYDARSTIAKTLNVADNEIIFTSNCTEALNLAILGLNLNGHVITTAYEHNSVLRPLKFLENRKKIRLTIIYPDKDGIISKYAISDAIEFDTKLICVNHISNVTGAMQDIEGIGHIAINNGILFLVDAAQSYGHINIDVKNLGIDFLAAAGHKGVYGPQGIGFLAATGKTKLYPIKHGGTGTFSESLYQPTEKPEGLECGTLNTPAIVSLKESVKWTFSNMNVINHKLKALNEQLLYGLGNINKVKLYSKSLNNVFSFSVLGMTSGEVSDMLSYDYNIATRSGLHCAPLIHKHLGTLNDGLVRASIGYSNTKKDIIALLNALEKICSIKKVVSK